MRQETDVKINSSFAGRHRAADQHVYQYRHDCLVRSASDAACAVTRDLTRSYNLRHLENFSGLFCIEFNVFQ